MTHPAQFKRAQNKNRWFRLRLKFYTAIMLIFLAILGAFYIFRAASIFKIQAIEITGIDGIEKENLLSNFKNTAENSKIASILGNQSYFSYSEDFADNNPKYKSIEIEKNILRRKISINAVPRERFGVWCHMRVINTTQEKANFTEINPSVAQTAADKDFSEGSRQSLSKSATECWWFDKEESIAIEKTLEVEGSLIIRIDEKTSREISAGEKLIPVSIFENIKKIIAGVKTTGINVKNYEIDSIHQEFSALSRGAKIIFSLRFDPSGESIPALRKILKEDQLSKIEYIDLTVENKVYLKRK